MCCKNDDSTIKKTTGGLRLEPQHFNNIYDRISKRCLSLSKRSTINLINGIYNKEYPPDSQVDYNWTEHTADDMTRTLADTIVTINRQTSYHIEIQMYPEGESDLRMFEYGYRHALTTRDDGKNNILRFPEPHILYLYENGNAPDYQELTVDFGEQGTFCYRVPTFNYLKMPLEELEKRKLVVLIPFQLLRLRKAIEKERTPENIAALKTLISRDIMETIKTNEEAGNISHAEGVRLGQMALLLYHHLYDQYEEMEREGVNIMAEEALILDIDIIEHQYEKTIQAIQKEQFALKLMLKGFSDEEIQKETGFSLEELKALRE